MSRIPEKVVAEVVTEVSERMRDPGYAQLAIGSFAEAHPDAGRFIAAHLDELGGGEAVMQVVFHAEVIHECFRRHLDRSLPRVGFRDLDAVANGELVDALQKRQPALADYVASNVDDEASRSLLAHVALAMADVA